MDRGTTLWQPPPERIRRSQLTAFAAFAHARYGAPAACRGVGDNAADPELAAQAWSALHEWSIGARGDFWSALWEYTQVIGTRGRETEITDSSPSGAHWFADSQLNYAENLLAGAPEQCALVARDESGNRRSLTRGELTAQVQAVAAAFAAAGVQQGDVVAGVMANTPEAIIAMLATAWLGATWTSTSPEFGATSIVERFGQTGAKLLVAVASYHYAGKLHDCTGTLEAVVQRVASIRTVVLVGDSPQAAGRLPQALPWEAILRTARQRGDDGEQSVPLPPVRVPFNSPLFILYSSGTTGVPKAIIHGVGGTLLQHRKEHLLHTDIRAGDVVFYYTTCGWMMWNWLASALASQATLLLYDGSPTHPDIHVLWRIAEEEKISVFGTSPRYLAALEQNGIRPRDSHDLAALRTVLSTGSPLSAGQFDFVYNAIKADVHLASISGGTDIVSCFCLGNPWLPVRRGEIQAPGLGVAADVLDEHGNAVREERGELACTAPFPAMPLGFLADPDQTRYRATYFNRVPGIWYHGDYAVRTRDGGFVILGRSDAVLNPGGVRIGTAEIYRQVESISAVAESLAIGQKQGSDERIILFVRLAAGHTLDAALEQQIRSVIRSNTTPRHVPAKIIAVADLPRTLSGKLAELAVRDVVNGQVVKNRDALANPESLELFRDMAQLKG